MPMITLAKSLIITSGALVLLAAYQLFRAEADPEPPLKLESSQAWWKIQTQELDCGVLSSGEHTIRFAIRNQSQNPQRILGLSQGCTRNCCYEGGQPGPLTVLPGAIVSYPCQLAVNAPGEIRLNVVMFLEDAGIREVTFSVRGLAVQHRKTSK